MSTEVEVVDMPTLEELGREARTEIALARADLDSAVRHAIAAGKALLSARSQIPHGEWDAWIRDTVGIQRRASVNQYMRLATYEKVIGEQPTIRSALALVKGQPDATPATKPRVWVEKIQLLKASGMSQADVCRVLGMAQANVSAAWIPGRVDELNAKQRERARRKRAELRDQKKALIRERRNTAAKRAGGGISDCYSRIRLTAEALDVLGRDGESEEVRKRANAALRSIYRAEEEIVALLGVT